MEIDKALNVVENKVHTLLNKVKNQGKELSQGMSFLHLKNQVLCSYAAHHIAYASLKISSPESLEGHPIFTELIRLRTLMERMRPMGHKLKYQIDKLMAAKDSTTSSSVQETLQFAPNPSALISKVQEKGTKEVYTAPRLASVPYHDESIDKRKAKMDEKNKRRLQKSTLMTELAEEFSERPMELLTSGSTALNKTLAMEESEKTEYEESRFVRLVTSKKDKIRKRQGERDAMQMEGVADIDNIASVQSALGVEHRKSMAVVTKPKVGRKTGGIFAHVDLPVTLKRGRSAAAASSLVTATPTPLALNTTTATTTKKKQKIAFSTVFGS